MNEKNIIAEAVQVPQTMEALAQQLKAKYPIDVLFEIEIPVSTPAMSEAI